MNSTEREKATKQVSLPMLLVAGLLVQLLSGLSLWQHNSTNSEVLGRFSLNYTVVLGVHALILLIWCGLVWQHRQVEILVKRIPATLRIGVFVVGSIAVLIVWLISVETVVKEYLSITWICVVLSMVVTVQDIRFSNRRWLLLLGICLLLLLVLMYIGVLADRRFEPDEAAWADRSEAIFSAGGLYTRTYYWPETPITPGYGWFHAVYGWLLHNVAFDLSVGRTLQFLSYLIAFIGIGLISARLYGRYVAVATVAFASLSQTFIPYVEYRGNLQIPAVATFIVFTCLQARYTFNRSTLMWHFLCGLLATLSLQVHASGIIFAFAMSLFYIAEFGWLAYRHKRFPSPVPLIAFGLGALMGTALYYQFNVLPNGGVVDFVQRLQADRGTFHKLLPSVQQLLKWPSMIEGALILFGLLYILWRRNQRDRVLIALIVCILIGAAILDTQGYLHTFNAFLVIPAGILLVNGFGQQRRRLLTVSVVLLVMSFQMYGLFLNQPGIWNWFSTGQLPPFFYKEIKLVLEPYVRPEDIIVSTHQIIWSFPGSNLVSHAAGGQHVSGGLAAKNGPFATELDLWEDVSPTLIVYIENEMHFDPGLQEFMELHNFQVCAETELMGRAIQIYRTTCL